MKKPHEILIVGAGPTGLTLANDLARSRVPFRIIDAKPGPTKDSKGLALNISSQYGLSLLGVNQTVGKKSKHIERLNIHWKDKRYSSINFNHLGGDVQNLITQPQCVTEAELLKLLELQGHHVHWSHKLTDIQENENSITTTIYSEGKELEKAMFQYAVGCDGKYSEVRKHINTSFNGFDYNMYFVLGDFKLDLDISDREVQYYIYPDTFFILVPIGKNKWRIVVKYDGDAPTQTPLSSEIEAVISRRFGKEFTLNDPLWISRAPFYNRVAGRICSKRLFIAGDAAHLFSPIGGTGMNTGLQDAFNLGWKFSFVYQNISNSSLLETYEKERLPAIQEAAKTSDISTQLITGKLIKHPLIKQLAPFVSNRKFLRNILPKVHSGIAQKTSIANVDSHEKTNNLGCFSPAISYLAHNKLLIPRDSHSQPEFWCLISITWLSLPKAKLNKIRERVLKHRKAQIIYFYFNKNINKLNGKIIARERIIKLPSSVLLDTPQTKDFVIVRPDGIIMYESNDEQCKKLEQAINDNFHFHPLKTFNTVAQNEKIF